MCLRESGERFWIVEHIPPETRQARTPCLTAGGMVRLGSAERVKRGQGQSRVGRFRGAECMCTYIGNNVVHVSGALVTTSFIHLSLWIEDRIGV